MLQVSKRDTFQRGNLNLYSPLGGDSSLHLAEKRDPPGGFSAARGRRALYEIPEGHVSEEWERMLRDYVKRKYALNSRKRGPPVGFAIARGKRNGNALGVKRDSYPMSTQDLLNTWNKYYASMLTGQDDFSSEKEMLVAGFPSDRDGMVSEDSRVPNWKVGRDKFLPASE